LGGKACPSKLALKREYKISWQKVVVKAGQTATQDFKLNKEEIKLEGQWNQLHLRDEGEIPQEKIVPLKEGIAPEPLKQKARDFFEALIKKDFEKAYAIGVNDYLRTSIKLEENEYYSNVLRIISIGEPYQKEGRRYAGGRGVFVPYEIELANGKIRRGFIAMRNDNPEGKWIFDGGL